jgi:hypothetical protein
VMKRQHPDSNIRVEFDSDEGLYVVDAFFDPESIDILATYFKGQAVDFPEEYREDIYHIIERDYEEGELYEDMDECLGAPEDFDELQEYDDLRQDLKDYERIAKY